MNKEEILKNLDKYTFYHHIKLNDDITTPGIGRSQIKVNIDEINKIDFKNKKVLDIGCRDGLYSFEAEKLGATSAGCRSRRAPDAAEVHVVSPARAVRPPPLHFRSSRFKMLTRKSLINLGIPKKNIRKLQKTRR